MSRAFFLPIVICGALLGAGCGGQGELDRFQIELTPAVGHANSMRSLISSLQQQFQSEGLPGLNTELATLDERLEEFTGAGIGDAERATYDKIIPRLKDLSELAASKNASKSTISERLQELESLALSLPKAESTAAGKTTT